MENPPKSYKKGNEISCETYLKTNLIYDLSTNNAEPRITEFTEIFYFDYRKRKSPRQLKNDTFAGFNDRYIIFQNVSSDQYPGEEVGPVVVDVMFQIVTINERKIVNYYTYLIVNY